MAGYVAVQLGANGESPACRAIGDTDAPMPAAIHIADIDTETTGLSAATDCIIEVAVKVFGVDATGHLLREVAIYQTPQDFGIRISRHPIALHGIIRATEGGATTGRTPSTCAASSRADFAVVHGSVGVRGKSRRGAVLQSRLWPMRRGGSGATTHHPGDPRRGEAVFAIPEHARARR